jgi:hypothetical protein
VRVGGGSLKGSHVGPFGLWKPKGPYRRRENYAEPQTVSAGAEQEIPDSAPHNGLVDIIRSGLSGKLVSDPAFRTVHRQRGQSLLAACLS